jgi:hypothetical protein
VFDDQVSWKLAFDADIVITPVKSLYLLAKFNANSPPREPPIKIILDLSIFGFFAIDKIESRIASSDILSKLDGAPFD